MRFCKRLTSILLTLSVAVTLCLACALPVSAVSVADLRTGTGFYARQQTSSTCTLASAAMMMRRRAYLDGLSDWASITEGSLRRVAWSYVGLSHEFSMKGITVQHGDFTRGTSVETQLISMLKEHPEGIVVYNKSVPHAILVTDYTDGVFYSYDPSSAAPAGRIPVSSSTISITNARYYWYVSADTNRTNGIGGSLTANEINYPTRLAAGADFDLTGTFTTPGSITRVMVTLSSDGGNTVLSAEAAPAASEFDLAELSAALDFSAVKPGSYTLRVIADDDYGGRISLRKQVMVGSGQTTTASYTGTAPSLRDINAVNLTESGFDVESTASATEGGSVSVIYSAWVNGTEQFGSNMVGERSGDVFTTHITANAGTLGIDSFLINITALDADGNSASGSLLVKVGVEDADNLTADQTLL